MTKIPNPRQYDLEERTLRFAQEVRNFIKKLPKTLIDLEDGKQLIRSSGSIGANYIEANESLSRKDFVMRVMICRKEAKESEYWLNLITAKGDMLEKDRVRLRNEVVELRKIFGAILEKSRSF